jgi:hypothetical protein
MDDDKTVKMAEVMWSDELQISADVVDALMSGSIDLHVHAGPDSSRPRRQSCVATVLSAREANIRAIVLKNHQYMTAPLATVLNSMPELRKDDSQGIPFQVFGGIALNREIGGVNPAAVESAARLGARIVWMPTLSAAYGLQQPRYVERKQNDYAGIRILNDHDKLIPEVFEIFDIVRDHSMILATGHLSIPEISKLIDAASSAGIDRILVNHPQIVRTGPNAPIEVQREWANKGAIMEHCYAITMPAHDQVKPMSIAHAIREIGYERCVMSTDFGQAHNPPPPEGMRMFITTMLECGLPELAIRSMVCTKPSELLDLSGKR